MFSFMGVSFVLSRVVHGAWGNWENWEQCSNTCNGGRRSRKRSCNRPPPSNGGDTCPDAPTESSSCNTQPCAGRYYPLLEHPIIHIYQSRSKKNTYKIS